MIQDSPDWKEQHPTGPVHFEVTCDGCGYSVLDVHPSRLDCGPSDYQNIGIARRVNGQWLCAVCAPVK